MNNRKRAAAAEGVIDYCIAEELSVAETVSVLVTALAVILRLAAARVGRSASEDGEVIVEEIKRILKERW